MDETLNHLLVCPRDRRELRRDDGSLVCRNGHVYPVYEGIPVLLLDDVEQTAWWADKSIQKARSRSTPTWDIPLTSGSIDPHVQEMVSGTCGHLYRDLVGRLEEYPIPELRLPSGNRRVFLDIGCNWGRWSVAAARKGYRVLGIDPSLGATLAARRVCQQLGVEATFAVADGRFLPLGQGSIDVAFSYSVIQHFSKENAKAALHSIASVLRTGGIALIQMPNKFGIRSLYHLARRGFTEGDEFDVRYYTVPELRQMFRSIFGNAEASVDGYFGLGIQPRDISLLSLRNRAVVHASEMLRRFSKSVPSLIYAADSVYIRSIIEPQTAAADKPEKNCAGK